MSATGFGSDYGAVAEEDVTIRLKRRQLAAEGALERLGGFFSGLRTKAGFTDYRHTEFEGDETGTVFKSRGGEARAELLHGRTGGFEGAWGARAGADRFSAEGEEAFLPASRTVSGEVFAFEEWARGGTRAQLAARAQFQRVRPEGGAARRDWTGAFSAGVVRDIGGGCAVTLSVTRSGRAPSAQELFADGPHAGTGAFEIGDSALACERVWSGDLGITRKTGRVTGALRVFATRFDGFISERATGEVRDGLPVYRFAQSDAVFWGAEAEAVFKLLDAPDNAVELRVTADAVRAETRGGARGRLPRMTPSRAGAELTWRGRWLTATAGLRAADRARRPAAEETATAGWCLVNAEVAVPVRAGGFSGEFFLRGTNLTNQLARNHVSLLKDKMAAGRRGVTAGARVAF
ncbi:MAG: TonB-dependent receptor [Opitutaceae bacterium]|nr:TonB-dependent receptor [Opitutaceae bacterium]